MYVCFQFLGGGSDPGSILGVRREEDADLDFVLLSFRLDSLVDGVDGAGVVPERILGIEFEVFVIDASSMAVFSLFLPDALRLDDDDFFLITFSLVVFEL